MRATVKLAIVAVVTCAAAGVLPVRAAGALTCASMTTKADFNGDGYADLVVGVPDDHLGDVSSGSVNVIYGSASGPAGADNRLSYLPVENDDFGAALTWGDFNGDGTADLAVGIPARDTNGVWNSGAVVVYPGSASGLNNGNRQLFDQGDGVGDQPEPGDHFGAALAAGDLNADGCADLVVGAPDEDLPAAQDAGVVHVLFGSASGVTKAEDQLWSQDSPGVTSAPDFEEQFGAALVVANLGNGSYADLAIGVPGQDVGSKDKAGAVNVLYGSAIGPGTANTKFLHQDCGITAGDGAEPNDRFGSSLAAGDFHADGVADLAVGVPFEDKNSTVADIGAVHVLDGTTSSAVACSGGQFWHQDSSGVADAEEAGDQFGSALATGKFDGNDSADLAIGAPGESIGSMTAAGAVHVLYGSPTGLTADGDQLWTQGLLGASSEGGDRFGKALFAANFGKDGRADLAIGIPHEDIDVPVPFNPDVTIADAGGLSVVFGTASGLGSSESQYWSQRKLTGSDRISNEHFGTAIA